MNRLLRYLAVCLTLAACSLDSLAADMAEVPPRLSLEGLEKESPKGVAMMGTFFRTQTGDFINFIPVELKTTGVWTRSLTEQVKEAALKQIKPSQHVPVIVLCDIVVQPANPPARRPGVTTGAYFGPINMATVTTATYLSKEAAAEKAKELIKDEDQRTRFLARFK